MPRARKVPPIALRGRCLGNPLLSPAELSRLFGNECCECPTCMDCIDLTGALIAEHSWFGSLVARAWPLVKQLPNSSTLRKDFVAVMGEDADL